MYIVYIQRLLVVWNAIDSRALNWFQTAGCIMLFSLTFTSQSQKFEHHNNFVFESLWSSYPRHSILASTTTAGGRSYVFCATQIHNFGRTRSQLAISLFTAGKTSIFLEFLVDFLGKWCKHWLAKKKRSWETGIIEIRRFWIQNQQSVNLGRCEGFCKTKWHKSTFCPLER